MKVPILLFYLFFLSFQPILGGDIRYVTVGDAKALQELFKNPVDSIDINLVTGEYDFRTLAGKENTCANCEIMNTQVHYTYGLHIRGNYVRISAKTGAEVLFKTNSGYGIYVDGVKNFQLENLAITAGKRDTSEKASSAAIVIKNSIANLRQITIYDNIGDSTILAKNTVGIIGICGREGADISIENCYIRRNSWDGIALYRDATARIYSSVIDGVDKAKATEAGGGRGVGIGVTHSAKAEIRNNLIRNYWKGIGVFADAQAIIQFNIIEDILAWGIALWEAGDGRANAVIHGNVIMETGACGVSISAGANSAAISTLSENLIIHTAQNPKYDESDYYCHQCALALHKVPKGFNMKDNVFFGNRVGKDYLPEYNNSFEDMMQALLSKKELFRGRLWYEISKFNAYNPQN